MRLADVIYERKIRIDDNIKKTLFEPVFYFVLNQKMLEENDDQLYLRLRFVFYIRIHRIISDDVLERIY
jgi:hypothetical protein